MKDTSNPTAYSFLSGGGEMGMLTRNFDWTATSLGSPAHWPKSLRSYLSLLLNSRFPMFLFWGPELVCFYNDAYRPTLGENGKHPRILGMPGEKAWAENWDFIEPMIKQILAGGEAAWYEDQLIRTHRNGQLEDVYGTFSYSPVTDDDDHIAGVFVTCTETTKAVSNFKKLQESEERFRSMAEGTDVLIALTDTQNHYTYFNKPWEELTGRPMQQLLTTGWADLVHPDDRDRYEQLFRYAHQSTSAFNTGFRILNKDGAYRSLLAKGVARFDPDGAFTGYIISYIDITDQVLDKAMLQQSETHLELLSNTVPAMIFYLDAEQRYQSYNERFMEWFGVGKTEVIGKTVREFLGEATYQKVEPHLAIAYAGKQERFELEAPQRIGWANWLSIVYTPHQTPEGKVIGLIVHVTNITQTKHSELALRESEARFRSLIEEAPVATCFLLGRELKIDVANDLILAAWGKDSSVIGMPLALAVPELEGQPFLDILDEVYTTGKPYSETAARAELKRNGKWGTYFYNYTYKPLFNEAGEVYGIMDMAVDVTEQVLVQQRIMQSQRELLASFNDSPVGLALITGEELVFKMVNPFYAMLTARDPEALVDKPLLEAMPELRGQGFDELLFGVMRTGKAFTAKEVGVDLERNGRIDTIYVDFTYQPQRDETGKISGVFVVVIEVTQQVISRKNIEEKEAALRNAIELADLGTWSMDVATGMSTLSKRHVDMFGLGSTVTTAEENIAMIVEADRDRVAQAFRDALLPGSNGRYEAEYEVVNAATGDHIIVRALGQVHYDKDKKPVRIDGTAQDITVQRRTREALEAEVQKRTRELAAAIDLLNNTNRELKRSNSNLEEFAHAASHDLKEPVRKVLFFASQLREQLSTHLTEKENHSFNRIETATKRMGQLIDDLLLYSHASDRPLETELVNLNQKIQKVLEDLELDIQEKKAIIQVGPLPSIRGYRRQLQQLFQNLISNALKYIHPGQIPQIDISSGSSREGDKNYHVIIVQDNGIGFEQEYADKIFQMFTRLHGKNEYSGTGVGLSIVRKVVQNHNGFIRVKSAVGEGSTFKVYLPADQ